MPRLATYFLILVLLPVSTVAQPQIGHLLGARSEPDGVAFEILDEDEDALTWALPLIRQLAKRLRTRFPELPIPVVSHGSEQFALLGAAIEGPLAEIHDEARDLAGSQIELHVCGAHAGWYGHDAEDFPDYIDVAASAPALINDYRALGYEIVRLREPDS